MKKILLAIAAVALLFATSCKKESINPSVDVPEGSFLATIDNGANPQNAPRINDGMGTMTTITTDRYVIWESGDEISINGSIYTTDASGSSVLFSGGNAIGPKYHAFYPASIAGEGAAGVLPDTQTYVSGKVSNLPMYANSESNQLTFHNICAVLKIEIPAFLNGATCIEVSSDKALHGTFTIGDNFAATVADATTDADKKLTVKKSGNVVFDENDTVYIAVPAQSYESLKVEFFNGANSIWTKTVGTQAEPIVLAVNKIYNINATPMGLCFTALAATNINMDYTFTKGGNTPVIYLEYCKYDSNTKTYGSWNKFIKTSDLTSTTTSQTGAATTVSLAAGDKVFFRAGDGTQTARTNSNFGIINDNDKSYFSFTSTGNVEVSGNIMYLLSKTPSAEFPQGSNSTFYSLFYSMSNLTKADGLMLPATTLAEKCYLSMFRGCTGLTTAPVLPATTLATRCYCQMFYKCTNLAEVTMKATDVSATDCLYMWLILAGTSSGSHILKVDNSMTSNSYINSEKYNFTIQSYNPPSSVIRK